MHSQAAEIIKLARECVGAPFRHQGRTKRGLDCVGLVLYPAFLLGLPVADYDGYQKEPNPKQMGQILSERGQRVTDIEPGDVLWFRIKSDPQHLAIYTGETIIHAANGHGVIEHGYRAQWPRLLYRAYRYPERV